MAGGKPPSAVSWGVGGGGCHCSTDCRRDGGETSLTLRAEPSLGEACSQALEPVTCGLEGTARDLR